MSILFLSSSGKLHETALSMEIGTKSTLNMHQVDELDLRIGTMLKLYRHHRGGDHLRPKGAISGHNGAIMGPKAPKHIRSVHREKCKT